MVFSITAFDSNREYSMQGASLECAFTPPGEAYQLLCGILLATTRQDIRAFHIGTPIFIMSAMTNVKKKLARRAAACSPRFPSCALRFSVTPPIVYYKILHSIPTPTGGLLKDLNNALPGRS